MENKGKLILNAYRDPIEREREKKENSILNTEETPKLVVLRYHGTILHLNLKIE